MDLISNPFFSADINMAVSLWNTRLSGTRFGYPMVNFALSVYSRESNRICISVLTAITLMSSVIEMISGVEKQIVGVVNNCKHIFLILLISRLREIAGLAYSIYEFKIRSDGDRLYG